MSAVSQLSASSSFKITPRSGASKSGSRSWKDLTKSVAKAAGYAALASLAMLSVAALIVGIFAMVNPVGLGLIGTSIAGVITGGLAFAAENAFMVIMAGVVGGALTGIAALIIIIVKKCSPPNIDPTINPYTSSTSLSVT